MKRLLLLLVVGLAVFIAVNRMRLFVWDPIATVTRNGVKDSDARASINYANDVLLADSSGGQMRRYVLQHGRPGPIAPAVLKCLRPVACLTDADRATGTPVEGRGTQGSLRMTDRVVDFLDEDGAAVEIRLR